jgi:hypothetical protein
MLTFLVTGKKKRGRPRKVRTEKPSDLNEIAPSTPSTQTTTPADAENADTAENVDATTPVSDAGSVASGDQKSAVQGLLELSNMGKVFFLGGDGGRCGRKKTCVCGLEFEKGVILGMGKCVCVWF